MATTQPPIAIWKMPYTIMPTMLIINTYVGTEKIRPLSFTPRKLITVMSAIQPSAISTR